MDKTFNVIICALNSKYIHSSLAPWYLLAGIKQWCGEGINASVLEGTINDDTGKIFAKIADKKPNVLGFCCYIWNITAVLKLSKLVKENSPDTILVLGGPEVSYNAGRLLEEHPFIDCIISG
ncbi:MAG TPA: cobalamin B12-binding domain-containing protein, partial [Candidatus Avimonas sp.]|nr:cobalamin B12-binding domain-containing protein [Candidatus Avimonas sp.]